MPAANASPAWRPVAALLLLLGLSGCVTTSAEDDPLQVRLEDMDRRLGRVERVAGSQTLLEMSQRIDTLLADVRRLRGQVEVLENGNEALRKQQRDLYSDLERRMAALQGAPAGAGAGAPPAAGGDTAEQRYARAFDALRAADYPAAITGMRGFLAAHSDHDLAGNAQYWLGEAYYVTRDYDNAIAAFTVVGQRWPQSSKAPDALLKLGYAQFEAKRLPEAKQTLSQVGARYPGTDAARLAQERLRRIP